ncbi:EAL domain-containing protein [Capilliphycus salinus ALCB114379]|uniref:EAL domain-containing protein n=1 Tax=Capilliphycus salinus TaxID=2768948 RepID=UPI0039A60B99
MPHQEYFLHQITNRIRQSLELSEILNAAVEEIRLFLKVDRVKIYRFDSDGSGEVIAESLEEDTLPSLLNLKFPATDIPNRDRQLFIKARQRVIVDVAAGRRITTRLDCQKTGEQLSEVDIRYAPIDPCHVQYLTAMGVQASLVTPILHGKHLWGLLAVHHRTPRPYSEGELQIIQLIVDQVSIAISQSDLLTRAREQARYEAIVNQVSQLLHCPLSVNEIRQRVLEQAVTALNGSGGRLYIIAEPTGISAQLYTTGVQPRQPFLEEIPLWKNLIEGMGKSDQKQYKIDSIEQWQRYNQKLLHSQSAAWNISEQSHRVITLNQLQADPCLAPLATAFEGTPIRSIALIPLQFHSSQVGCLTIFRNGYNSEIYWAGRNTSDERNKMPRASFEAWREQKFDQAPSWSPEELKLAKAIGVHLYMAIAQKRVESIIRYQASHDALTRLPNRLLFDEQLALALANSKQHPEILGVAFLDLDRFKVVNDTLGHATGDRLLQQVATRLKQCLRNCDTIARWGGDEFTLLFPHLTSEEEISKIAQKILDKLSIPFAIDNQELYVTASLGIALCPYDAEDAQTLLKHADAAMYRAKQQGRNAYQLFAAEMHHQAVNQLTLEGDLRRALAREEFVLYYQPQVEIATGRIVGLEALIRWQHPQLGFVSPGEFIPLAEEIGLISPIGQWVLQTACIQHQAWRTEGFPPLRVAVNLSARQFHQSHLTKIILQTLEATEIDPQYLELEITETAAMQDVDFTITILRQLREMGLHITIDDFGTGYSSLNVLKHFPLNTLKIDRSFVKDIVENSHDAAIAQTIVALGQGLKMQVLAEGVETSQQLSFLHSMHCDLAQGYYFCPPVPATEIGKLLRQSYLSVNLNPPLCS